MRRLGGSQVALKKLLFVKVRDPCSHHESTSPLLRSGTQAFEEFVDRRYRRSTVADLFGVGVRPNPPQSPMTVVGPFLDDRLRFRLRLMAGLRAFQQRPECNADRVAAIGYCIGGCGVLDLARAGAALRGVVSLHGFLGAPIPAQRNNLVCKILVLHGDADPVASTESVTAFQKEMRLARANWQINIYSDAKHSFTGEGVGGDRTPGAGLHPQTEARSWQTTVEFLREVFGEGN